MSEHNVKTGAFKGVNDRYNGITISSDVENCSAEEFPIKLEESLNKWTEEKRRGIWFKIFLDQSDWIPHLAKNGFKYHHAKENFVMMYKWLPTEELCNIPPYAHTTLGVGGLVINDKSEILVVKEKYSYFEHWKLPGGYVEPNENLIEAAIREVIEETGIETEFISLLSFVHAHGGVFGCSDMYVIVALKALSTELKRCSRELDDCQWMDINSYLSHPEVINQNKFFVNKYLEHNKHDLKIDCQKGEFKKLKREYRVYHVIKDKL